MAAPSSNTESAPRIGIAGTGFIGAGLVELLRRRDDLALGPVLTRRDRAALSSSPAGPHLTDDLARLVGEADVVVECSGDVRHAARVVAAAHRAGRPVVTMNAEFHVSVGSAFVGSGVLTEAEGDQPGSLAALRENALQMGFRPLVLGNVKRFLDPDPDRAEMERWSRRNRISLEQVTAFTDGTKLQVEQVLVANGLGAEVASPGRFAVACDSVDDGARALAEQARRRGAVLSDYVFCRDAGPGVFVAAEHDAEQREALSYLRLGDGPTYVLRQTFHLCHLEVLKTVWRVLTGGGVLIDNSPRPRYAVAARAKRTLEPGTRIERACGGFELRGDAVACAEHRDLVPLGLLDGAVLRRRVERGMRLVLEDVEIPASEARDAWERLRARGRDVAPVDGR